MCDVYAVMFHVMLHVMYDVRSHPSFPRMQMLTPLEMYEIVMMPFHNPMGEKFPVRPSLLLRFLPPA